MRLRKRKIESYEAFRRRLIQETEAALLYGLRFPNRAVRIPTIEVGRGSFDPTVARRWWSQTLNMDEEDLFPFDKCQASCRRD